MKKLDLALLSLAMAANLTFSSVAAYATEGGVHQQRQ